MAARARPCRLRVELLTPRPFRATTLPNDDLLPFHVDPTGAALIAATVLATLVNAVDASVVNVAVPAIGRELGRASLRSTRASDQYPHERDEATQARLS